MSSRPRKARLSIFGSVALPWLSLLLPHAIVVASDPATTTTMPMLADDPVKLPFGDINVLILTDVHSWVGGHNNSNSGRTADYGDVLSFYQRLHTHCTNHGMDLWFVVNGDCIDGTGISLNGDVSYLTPVLEHMPWDALNIGNHELYRDAVINDFIKPGGYVEWWGDRYLTSNVIHTVRQEPLGQRFTFLRGTHATVLTFGFLYNMDDASSVVTVETVESVVEQEWFISVLVNPDQDPLGVYHAILVLAHMDVRDALVTVLLDKIRSLVGPDMPIQFVTGHTHERKVQVMDSASVSFEPGKFLDTIGFVSFPTLQTLVNASSGRLLLEQNITTSSNDIVNATNNNTQFPNPTTNNNNSVVASSVPLVDSTSAPVVETANVTFSSPAPPPGAFGNVSSTPESSVSSTILPTTTMAPTTTMPLSARLFQHVFIDTNVTTLQEILGVSDMSTEDGRRLSNFILRTRRELGLLEIVGCSPRSYFLNRSVTDDDSLWRFFLTKVAPYRLLKPTTPSTKKGPRPMFLSGLSMFRFDLFQQRLIVDDVIAVAPFNDTLVELGPGIPGAVIIQMMQQLNSEPKLFLPSFMSNYYSSPSLEELDANATYNIFTPSFGVPKILAGLTNTTYNGTIVQKNSNFTDTAVWLQYVKENWACHDDEEESSGSSNSSHHSGNHGHGKPTNTGAPHSYHTGNPGDDKYRLILASIGVSLMLILGSLYIWQLHTTWMQKYKQRQRLMIQIDNENDNELI